MYFRCFAFLIVFLTAQFFAGCKKRIKSESLDPQIEVLPPILTPITENINASIGGYYSGVPATYAINKKKYPLLFFIHGGGQHGNGEIDLPIILNEGIPQLLDEKIFPSEFVVNGVHFSFLILAPQFRKSPSNSDVRSFIDYALKRYRVDTSRIYMTGLSLGGRITCDIAAAYPTLFAAIVPMAGVPDSTNLHEKAYSLAKANLPIWVFHNDRDLLMDITFPKKFIQMLDSFHPAIPPRFTEFQSMGLLGHDAWTRATDPHYRESNKNIYEWMLSYHR